MHRENQGIATRIVLEDRLGWRIGENPPVPIELASGNAGGSAPDAMICRGRDCHLAADRQWSDGAQAQFQKSWDALKAWAGDGVATLGPTREG
jgi:hypothetical protein